MVTNGVAIALLAVTPASAQSSAQSVPSPRDAPSSAPPPEREDASRSLPWLDEAVERKRRGEEAERRRQAQYARNIYAVQAAFGREIVKAREEVRGYSGRIEFAMLIPTEDGASPLWAMQAGLSHWQGGEDQYGEKAWGIGIPLAFGYGYRTPWLIGYGGLSFGMGLDSDAEAAAGAYGFFGNLGIDVMGFRLLGDTRAEYRIMKAGQSRWHLTYGALASVNL